MGLSKIAVRRPVATGAILLLILLIGQEVDIDLNRMLAGQGNILSGGIGGGFSQVPVREIYWDDFFRF